MGKWLFVLLLVATAEGARQIDTPTLFSSNYSSWELQVAGGNTFARPCGGSVAALSKIVLTNLSSTSQNVVVELLEESLAADISVDQPSGMTNWANYYGNAWKSSASPPRSSQLFPVTLSPNSSKDLDLELSVAVSQSGLTPHTHNTKVTPLPTSTFLQNSNPTGSNYGGVASAFYRFRLRFTVSEDSGATSAFVQSIVGMGGCTIRHIVPLVFAVNGGQPF